MATEGKTPSELTLTLELLIMPDGRRAFFVPQGYNIQYIEGGQALVYESQLFEIQSATKL